MDPGRRAHYSDFYDGAPGRGQLALVLGNCQAESLRVLLAGSATFPLWPVRMPPVHEVTAADLAPLRALLPRVGLLACQPVRDDYRGLPIGSAQVAAGLPAGARVVRWPVIRYTGLAPFSAIVRHPDDRSAAPPVVPYHDLRTLSLAAGRGGRSALSPARAVAVADDSVAELLRRERAGTDVGVSDVLRPLGADAAHTLNHPGNPVLVELARRVQAAIGAPADAADPGRVLLGGIRAPLHPAVVAGLGLDAPPRPHWLVDGAEVAEGAVREAHLRWYSTHRPWVEAGLRRHAGRMALLGL